jgi:CDP-glycerol glycerophosphotransferase
MKFFLLKFLKIILRVISNNIPKNKKILLFIGNNKSFNSNTKYLFNYLSKYSEFICYWISFTKNLDRNLKKKNIKSLYYYHPKSWLIFLRSYCVFGVGLTKPDFNGALNNKTLSINLWHGFGPRSTNGAHNYPKKKILNKINEWDFFASPNKFVNDNVWIKQFKINPKKVIKINLNPNLNKNLFNINFYKKIKVLKKNNRLILYAPTWRQSYKKSFPLMDLLLKDINLLNNFFKKNQLKLIISSHINYEKNFNKKIYKNLDFIIKIPSNELSDINEIINICDYVITDYSSIATDAIRIKKPVYYFLNDYNFYRNEIGLLEDFKKVLPGLEIKSGKDFYKFFSKNYKINQNIQKKIKRNIKTYLNKYSAIKKNNVQNLINLLKRNNSYY